MMNCPICGAPTREGSPVALAVGQDGRETEVAVCDECATLLERVGYMKNVAGALADTEARP